MVQSRRRRYKASAFYTVALVFLVALTARLAFLAWRGPITAPDTASYIKLAQNIAAHGVFSLDTTPPWTPSIRRAPLYPVFLALCGWWGEPSPAVVAAVQAVLDAGVAVMVLLLARMTVPLRWAMAAALMYSIHPGAVHAASTLLSETVFTALLAGTLVVLALGLRDDRTGLTALSGVGLGLAVLCRPIGLLLPFALLGVLILISGLLRPYLHGLLVLACAMVMITPWVVRCSTLSHRLVLIQGYSAVNFYIPTRVEWDQRNQEKLWANFANDPYGRRLGAAHTAAQVVEADRFGFRQALQNVKVNPGKYLVSRGHSFPHLFLTSFDSFTGYNQSFGTSVAQRDLLRLSVKFLLLCLFSLMPFLLGIAGLAYLRHDTTAILCAAVWGYMWLIHLPMWIEYRFWLPAMPFLLVSAAVGAHGLLHRRIQAAES